MKGSELIAEYLVQQKVPYIFGICGHGTVWMPSTTFAAKSISCRLDMSNARATWRMRTFAYGTSPWQR